MAFLCFISDDQSVDMSGQVWGGGRGGGNCVTNYLVHFTPFLSVNFKVEKMSDVFCLFQDSANLKTDVG